MRTTARIKRVVVAPVVLFHILGTDNAWKVEAGIPEGSVYKGCSVDPLTTNLHIFVEHAEFPEVNIETEISSQIELLCKMIA